MKNIYILLPVLASLCFASCQYNTLETPVDCSQSNLDFTATVINTDCGFSTGSIVVLASGGESPYSYSLDGGAVQETGAFANLGAGQYSIRVTDNIGCFIEKTALLANINGLTVTATTTPSDCISPNGSITVNASNGVEPYQYQLQGAASQSSPDFTVGPGTYNITITDSNGCDFILTKQVNSTISYATAVQPIIVSSCAITGCHNGSNSSIPNFNNFSEVQANASMIRTRTQSGNMPKTGSITQDQKDIIACWVDDGALNN